MRELPGCLCVRASGVCVRACVMAQLSPRVARVVVQGTRSPPRKCFAPSSHPTPPSPPLDSGRTAAWKTCVGGGPACIFGLRERLLRPSISCGQCDHRKAPTACGGGRGIRAVIFTKNVQQTCSSLRLISVLVPIYTSVHRIKCILQHGAIYDLPYSE